jgi:hypothetical protein
VQIHVELWAISLIGHTSSNSVFPVVLRMLPGIIVHMSVWFVIWGFIVMQLYRSTHSVRTFHTGCRQQFLRIVYMTACQVVVFLVVHM